MVKLHDQTLRDAHQSILATRLRTEDMLPIAPKMDQVGWFSMEVWGGATFDVPIRYLNEDPWDRLRALKQAMPNTPLQMLERAMNVVAYHNFPDDIVVKFIQLAKKNGVDYFRIFDALNDLRNMRVPIQAAREAGGHVQACLSYTISPVHTVEKYVSDFLELERMGANTLCIKDMAGMIFPEDAYNIVKGYYDAGGRLPMDLHTHMTSGMGAMAAMRAIQAGCEIIDVGMSPLSGGTGQLPAESMVAALKGTKYDTGYDLKLLMEIRDYFKEIWRKYRHLQRIEAIKVDPSVTVHQIPGGMLSNLVAQLEQQQAMDRYDDVLREVPRVKEELGHPPLVTPTSQIVGVQAVFNVLFGRYKKVPHETVEYVRGMYGRPPAPIKKEIYELVLGKDWKSKLVECRPADLLEPQFEKRRAELKEMGLYKRDEDVLTYAIYPQVGLKFLRGEAKAEFTSRELPLPWNHPLTRVFVKSFFPEIKDPNKLWLEFEPPEARAPAGPPPVPTEFNVEVDGEPFQVKVVPTGSFIVAAGSTPAASGAAKRTKDNTPGAITTSLQGTIIKLKVRIGDRVNKGDTVGIIEAMKMEQDIKADVGGAIKEIFVKEGQQVSIGDVIMRAE
ncbi:MAG: pyruvate/oxaloacetate carboxyltransferase [Thermoplasmatota archaeon]